MSDFGQIPRQTIPTIRFESSPVHNMLCSLCLLNQDHLDHISPWVDEMLGRITEEEKAAAKKACEAGIFVADTSATDLAGFARELRERDPRWLTETQFAHLRQKAIRSLPPESVPGVDELAASEETYLELVRRLTEAYDDEFNREAAAQEYAWMTDSERFRDETATTIEHFWHAYLRDEWERVRDAVDDSVRALASERLQGGLEDRLKFVTGRDYIPEMWLGMLRDAREIVYVPSVHIGPYMILFDFDGSRAVIVGRAHIPEGSRIHSARLDHSELLMRLDALSDSTRLRILELAAKDGTITTQQIMDALELSQSSASRHLSQLAATGLLTVDGSERTKRYGVNPRRVDGVCTALRELVSPPKRG